MANFPPQHIGSELTHFQESSGGGGGTGTVTSITATTPIVVTPSPITNVGDVSHANSGVGAGTYGDATHYPTVTVDSKGHVTAASQLSLPTGGGTVTSITATAPIVVTPSPITGTGDVSHATSGVTAATYGDATHVAQFTVDAKGHITAASNVAIGNGLQSQAFTASGTFNVPTGVTAVWLTMIGGGGGGAGVPASTAAARGGASAGELVENLPWPVTSGGTATVTIGAKGTGGTAGVGTNGGATTFDNGAGLVATALGGIGSIASQSGANGGGNKGGAGATSGSVNGANGSAETPCHFGGGGGGFGGGASTAGTAGAGSGGRLIGGAGGTASGTAGGGGGGAASIWGVGGAAGNGNANGSNAASTSYGAGGGGSGGDNAAVNRTGGNGCDGYCLVVWVGG